MGMKGYDVFHELPGRVKARKCQVCKSWCIVARNCIGMTGTFSSPTNRSDLFICPHTDKRWHKKQLAQDLKDDETFY